MTSLASINESRRASHVSELPMLSSHAGRRGLTGKSETPPASGSDFDADLSRHEASPTFASHARVLSNVLPKLSPLKSVHSMKSLNTARSNWTEFVHEISPRPPVGDNGGGTPIALRHSNNSFKLSYSEAAQANLSRKLNRHVAALEVRKLEYHPRCQGLLAYNSSATLSKKSANLRGRNSASFHSYSD